MIYYLLLLTASSSSNQECDWDYGTPGDHNKHSDDDVRRSLIVNGGESHPHEYPWQVWISPIGCGGTIIGREYILSAAHCVNGNTPTVVAGLNRYRITGTWIPHEEYDDENILNDIAVIRLDEPLPCDDPTVNAIALPQLVSGFSLDECTAWVTGFGALQFEGFSPPGYQMHEVQTKVWSTDTCNQAPENVFRLPQTQICGFTPGKPSEDSCQGDSGGPFKIDIISDSKAYHKYVQVGVVSYGAGCGTYSGIYTDVSEYKDWILGKVPTAHFEQVGVCDRESYHEGIVDCEGRECRLEMPYCVGDSSNWRSENGASCASYSVNQLNCFADQGENLFASQVCSQCGYCRVGQENTQLSLTDEADCTGGDIPIEIEITTDVWAKEISFSIGDSCSGSGFQNHANHTSTCCLPPGEQVVNCRDAYGDGWHGAQLLVDGELKCGEFEAELQVESFFVASEGFASEGGPNGGAIAAGVIVPLFFIGILVACWFYCWPQFGSKAVDACEDCFTVQNKTKYDPESQRAPLSPEVTKSEFAYPAPIAPAASSRQRNSSYWNNFQVGPTPNVNALPQAPSIAPRAKMFRKAPPPAPKVSIAWHFTGPDGSSDVGPVSDQDFKSKIGLEIHEETYVWNGVTVKDWTYAKDVPELKTILATQKSENQRATFTIEWYYVDASGKDVGPVVDNIFRMKLGKQIVADTLVWNGTTVTDWTPAKEVLELKSFVQPKAPVRASPPKSRFSGRNKNTFPASLNTRKAAFATKRQASSKSGVSDLIARFNQN